MRKLGEFGLVAEVSHLYDRRREILQECGVLDVEIANLATPLAPAAKAALLKAISLKCRFNRELASSDLPRPRKVNLNRLRREQAKQVPRA